MVPRRLFLGGASVLAMLPVSLATTGASDAIKPSREGHTGDQIAARDALNVARSKTSTNSDAPSRYAPLTGNIIHFIGYGESLEMGWYGDPVLSTTQPFDNLMLGQATRAASNSSKTPISTTWVPTGPVGANGVYPFEPLIAVLEDDNNPTMGETASVAALNYLRRAYLAQTGQSADRHCHFVVTDCGIGGRTIAELSKDADPDIYNRLLDAAAAVKQAAQARGLTYQFGGVLWLHGEADIEDGVSYSAYAAAFKQLQQDVLSDILYGIAGAPVGTLVPWFCYQPDPDRADLTIAVDQFLLDWSNTATSDLYLAGPSYQYPDHSVHLTANGYRWDGNQFGKAMTAVLIGQLAPRALQMTSATFQHKSILVDFYVPVLPLIIGDACVQLTKTTFQNLGFIVFDDDGEVPIESVAIVGAATVQINTKKLIGSNPTLQAGDNLTGNQDWGTNICDSDATLAVDGYVYVAGEQEPGEDITTWNGAPLVGYPYPLNNYLAVGSVAITAEPA
jgi:hypothetical protein